MGKIGLVWLRGLGAWLAVMVGVGCCLGESGVPVLSLEQLADDPQLTPERLMRHVADFGFRLGEGVQAPRAFLTYRAGDCDDFATLAAEVLRRRGYTTHLVVVHLERDVHVVCYVDEIRGYLDYNRRRERQPVVVCNDKLDEVAQKVAASLRESWRTASEFVYESGRPKYLQTIFR
jgi:hypothetical protein